jgi:hypothetical protein
VATVRLRNVSPLGALDLPLIGRTVEAGEVFDVDASLAGRAPSAFRPVEADEQAAAHLTRPVLDGDGNQVGVEIYDPGEGLLAQVGNFELVIDKTKK